MEILNSKLYITICDEFVNDVDGMTYILHGLSREDTVHHVLNKLLVSFGRSRMPPVQRIEL